jgi:hypothetical protein
MSSHDIAAFEPASVMRGDPIVLRHDVGFHPHGTRAVAFIAVRVRLARYVGIRLDMISVATEMSGSPQPQMSHTVTPVLSGRQARIHPEGGPASSPQSRAEGDCRLISACR